MVVVAQLVRALVCGTKGRRFEPGLPPKNKASQKWEAFFVLSVCFFLKNWIFITQLSLLFKKTTI